MKKATWKRVCLELIQHLLAAGIMLTVAGLILNSYISVDSIDGPKIYKVFPIDTGLEFEDSEIYQDLFRNAVSDITQLVVLKGQLETEGILDPAKQIDVTKYASQIGADLGCALTVVYALDDIVKWGKSDVEYTDRFMSMSEFVNYFGYCIYPENFKLDEYGQLCFDDFYHISETKEADSQEDTETLQTEENAGQGRYGKSAEEIAVLTGKLKESMHFSFFTFFSDFVIFQVVKWMFLIFHDFQFSCHIPSLKWTFLYFPPFSVFLAIFHVLKCISHFL